MEKTGEFKLLVDEDITLYGIENDVTEGLVDEEYLMELTLARLRDDEKEGLPI